MVEKKFVKNSAIDRQEFHRIPLSMFGRLTPVRTLLPVLLSVAIAFTPCAAQQSLSPPKDLMASVQVSSVTAVPLSSLNNDGSAARLPPQPENENWVFVFGGTVQDLVPLTVDPGISVPVDLQPKFALSVQVKQCVPLSDEIRDGAIVRFAIRSPTRLFGPKSPKGLAYSFKVTRVVRGGHASYHELEPWSYTQNGGLLATADEENGVTYSVEEDGRHVLATARDGRTIWRRDPFVEAKLEPYRSKRPTISFIQLKDYGKEKFISVHFDSSQFGFIDPKTGIFTFRGQD